MQDFIVHISVGVFLLSLIIVLLLGRYVVSRKEHGDMIERAKRWDDSLTHGHTHQDYDYPGSEYATTRENGILRTARAIGMMVSPDRKKMSHTQLAFLRAGYNFKNPFAIYWGFKILFGCLLPLSFFVLSFVVVKTFTLAFHPTFTLFLIIWLCLMGFYVPNAWLTAKTQRRRQKLTEGFPDAFDMLDICVEAGMGLDAAISRVSEEMKLSNPEVAKELRLLSLELRAGKSREESLRSLARRTNLEDVENLVTLLIQSDRFGTGVAKALKVHANDMRVKRFQRAEEMAAKLPVKLVFPLIFFIFPALFITIMGPAAIRIYRIFLSH